MTLRASTPRRALDAAARLLSAALPGVSDLRTWAELTAPWAAYAGTPWRLVAPVHRRPTTALDVVALNDADRAGVTIAAALSEGETATLAVLLGSAEPYELLHTARLEVLAAGGRGADNDDALARAVIDDALLLCGDAIAADPTLGGLVAFAELDAAEPFDGAADTGPAFLGATAVLRLTYTARHPNA